VATITTQDRAAAQRLPDEFLELSGSAVTRVVELVTRHWGAYGEKKRAQLAEALFPILERQMQPETRITDETRDLCEGLVAAWIFRQP
jgi:hypothetical protein